MYKTDEERRLAITHRNMMARCYDPKASGYKNYGGKGIIVCKEWHDKFNFIKWGMATGFKLGLTIDRIYPSLNYEPSNCRWLSKRANATKRVLSDGTIAKKIESRKIDKSLFLNREEITEIRKAFGLNQHEMAFLCGTTQTTISGWETGYRSMGNIPRRLIEILYIIHRKNNLLFRFIKKHYFEKAPVIKEALYCRRCGYIIEDEIN